MSETPRTDAAVGYMEDSGDTLCASIEPEFVRELERELTAARAELAAMRQSPPPAPDGFTYVWSNDATPPRWIPTRRHEKDQAP